MKKRFTAQEEEDDEEVESSSPEEEYDDEEEDEDDEEEAEIKRELADHATFGDLQKARSDGSRSLPLNTDQRKKPGRANKNRPAEASSKKPVSRFRDVIQAPKRVVRDPRFESLCGKFDAEGFRKRYDFLYEDTLPAEKEVLQKQLRKTRDPKVIGELKNRISWIQKQMKFESPKRTEAKILAEHKKQEREAAKQGKAPFYLKKSEIRKRQLIEKYRSLKESGKLESFLEKRRKKNAAKDHRYMPYRRPNTSEPSS